LRALADGNSPIDQEQPDTVRQMPHGGGDSDHIDEEHRPHVKLAGHDVESDICIIRDRLVIQPRNQSEPEIEHVKSDEEE